MVQHMASHDAQCLFGRSTIIGLDTGGFRRLLFLQVQSKSNGRTQKRNTDKETGLIRIALGGVQFKEAANSDSA